MVSTTVSSVCNDVVYVCVMMMLLISLAGKPKKEGALKTFCLMLGHDYISDHITVCLGQHCERDTVLCMIVQLC